MSFGGSSLTDSRAKVQNLWFLISYDEDGTMEVGTIETMPGSWVLEVKNMKYLIIFLILVLLSVGLNAAADEDWTPEFEEFMRSIYEICK